MHLDRNGKAVVTVRENWEKQHLVRMGPMNTSAQLKFSPRLHILAAPVFAEFFSELADTSALNDVQTFDGGYVPRLKRGVTLPAAGAPKSAYDKLLSNHSRGCAIDINAKWNQMGHPALERGKTGSVIRIAEIARTVRVKQDDGTEWGIVWGGDWKGTSIDGMHFELGVWE